MCFISISGRYLAITGINELEILHISLVRPYKVSVSDPSCADWAGLLTALHAANEFTLFDI